jgi:hypothetical protein
MTPPYIKSGFTGTGIYPFNDHVVPDSAVAPSDLSFLQLSEIQRRGEEYEEDSNTDISDSSVNNKETLRAIQVR